MNKDRKKILGIFAHPDDEYFISGLLLRAINMGMETHLICATKGEAGRIRNMQAIEPKEKGEIRRQELQETCRILGVSTLNFLNLEDGNSDNWDFNYGVDNVAAYMNQIAPDIVITFEKNGGINRHKDHKKINKITEAAFMKMKNSEKKELYYSTLLPVSITQKCIKELSLEKEEKLRVDEIMSIPDNEEIYTLELEQSELEEKLKLLDVYRSQFPDKQGNYYYFSRKVIESLSRYESFTFSDNLINQGLSCELNKIIHRYNSDIDKNSN